VLEVFFEIFELPRVLDQLGLHLRSDLLEEGELLYNQVKVEHEGLLHELPDVVVQGWLDMEGLV